MGKIVSDTETIRALMKQLKVFVKDETALLYTLKRKYISVGSKWNDLQYEKFRDALQQNDKSVKKIVTISEEQLQVLEGKLKQLESYLENNKAASGISSNDHSFSVDDVIKEYVNELKGYSEVPETLKNVQLSSDKMKSLPSEDTEKAREEFCKIKNQLRQEWEIVNRRHWPVYKHDLVNKYGEVVRKRGWKYDAHHIQPLAMGGSNTADNITPLSYNVHSDHMGIHAYDSSYDLLDRMLRERNQ